MALCGSSNCNCALDSDSLSITGAGVEGDPYQIEFATVAPFAWDYIFASATQRDSTLIAPTEGMSAYLSDTNTLWRYNGSSWVLVWAEDQYATSVLTPGATDDAPTTPEAQWLTTSVTVPSWATAATVEVDLTNIDLSGSGVVAYNLRIRLGGSIQSVVCRVQHDGAITYTYSWSATITTPATGSQSLEIYAERVSGSFVLRAATTSRMWYRIRYS